MEQVEQTDVDDPIIPAFNNLSTKYNISLSGRDMNVFGLKNLDFTVNYKHVFILYFWRINFRPGQIPAWSEDAQFNFALVQIKFCA